MMMEKSFLFYLVIKNLIGYNKLLLGFEIKEIIGIIIPLAVLILLRNY